MARLHPGLSINRVGAEIFEATLSTLDYVALDAATGQPCVDFGAKGEVNLRNVPGYESHGLGEQHQGWYHMTSPPVTIDDLVILGSAIDDNNRIDMPLGTVRAFDTRTGAVGWSWEPIPRNHPADDKAPAPGQGGWITGAANAWSVMAVDADHDLVFVPTGSASPDYYGGLRPGDGKWANSVVALHAKTGALAWGFQLVHHDLWDYDTASPTLLATIPHDGKHVPVVIQGNEATGPLVLNRDTGVPVFPVEERPVPPSDVPGEAVSPTQPIPTAPPPVAPQNLTADEAWGPTPADREFCRAQFAETPQSRDFHPTQYPRFPRVSRQSRRYRTGAAIPFDPQDNLLFVNTNNLPARVRLIPRDKISSDNEDGNYGAQRGTPYGMLPASSSRL